MMSSWRAVLLRVIAWSYNSKDTWYRVDDCTLVSRNKKMINPTSETICDIQLP